MHYGTFLKTHGRVKPSGQTMTSMGLSVYAVPVGTTLPNGTITGSGFAATVDSAGDVSITDAQGNIVYSSPQPMSHQAISAMLAPTQQTQAITQSTISPSVTTPTTVAMTVTPATVATNTQLDPMTAGLIGGGIGLVVGVTIGWFAGKNKS